jgi:hypothetical protein
MRFTHEPERHLGGAKQMIAPQEVIRGNFAWGGRGERDYAIAPPGFFGGDGGDCIRRGTTARWSERCQSAKKSRF